MLVRSILAMFKQSLWTRGVLQAQAKLVKKEREREYDDKRGRVQNVKKLPYMQA